MAGEWQVLSLREAGVSLFDCEHRTPPAADLGYPYVAIPQIKNGRIDLTGVRRISHENFVTWTRKTRPQLWDVILSRRCNPGETAYVPPGLECALGQNLVVLRADGKRVLPAFVRWLAQSPAWWDQVRTLINVGAVFDSLKCADIPNFRLLIPPIQEQEVISHILGTLDDKIELNRRMNGTLEAMARAVFKSWFVDFDPVRAKAEGRDPGLPKPLADLFPNSFEDSALGKIPKGWRLCEVGDLGRITTGKTPSTKIEDNFGGELPFLTPSDMDSRIVIYSTGRYLTEQGGESVRSARIPAGAIAVSCIGSDMGKVVVTGRESVTNQQINSVTVGNASHREYLLFNLRGRKDEIRSLGSGGSAVPILNKAAFSRLTVLLPLHAVLEAYHHFVCPLLSLIAFNTREAEVLAAIRDTLLLKLLSGEIRVAEARKIVKDSR